MIEPYKIAAVESLVGDLNKEYKDLRDRIDWINKISSDHTIEELNKAVLDARGVISKIVLLLGNINIITNLGVNTR